MREKSERPFNLFLNLRKTTALPLSQIVDETSPVVANENEDGEFSSLLSCRMENYKKEKKNRRTRMAEVLYTPQAGNKRLSDKLREPQSQDNVLEGMTIPIVVEETKNSYLGQYFNKSNPKNRLLQYKKIAISSRAFGGGSLDKTTDTLVNKKTMKRAAKHGTSKNLPMYSKEVLEDERKGYLTIKVTDNGCGITEAEKAKLFKPFAQANKSVQGKYGGTGMGLWISSKLAEAMGSTLSCESHINSGTTFTLKIPTKSQKSKKV
jgi:hypothetical protein